ncbi:hypothetical protein WD019_12110 [Fictibacillus sp. Mic-4]|uniref:hypothetical protein n=1 Tax=Fictibacillus sp. Mic-4 TaxID=3132826 RepID=UPI003CE9213A
MDLVFIFDKLQGIEKVKPSKCTYGLDEPPSVSYNLNEKQINEIINDDLKIKYTTFKKAIISMNLQKTKKGMQNKKKDKNGQVISYDMGNSIFLESGNLDAKNKFQEKG